MFVVDGRRADFGDCEVAQPVRWSGVGTESDVHRVRRTLEDSGVERGANGCGEDVDHPIQLVSRRDDGRGQDKRITLDTAE